MQPQIGCIPVRKQTGSVAGVFEFEASGSVFYGIHYSALPNEDGWCICELVHYGNFFQVRVPVEDQFFNRFPEYYPAKYVNGIAECGMYTVFLAQDHWNNSL